MGYVERMLGQNEKKVFVTHQHWMTLASALLGNLALALVIVIVAAIVIGPMTNPLGWLALVLLVVPIGRFIWAYLVWTNREYIITNRRVIQMSGVVNKNVFDSSLEKVNDVKLTQSFFGRIFNFGTVEILTASEIGVNQFNTLEDPIKFKTTMINAKEALELGGTSRFAQRPPAPAAPAAPNDISALIAQLDNLRQQGLLTQAEFQAKKEELLKRM